MIGIQERVFVQRRAAIYTASTYFRTGGRDVKRISAVLRASCPDLTEFDVERLISACVAVEITKSNFNGEQKP